MSAISDVVYRTKPAAEYLGISVVTLWRLSQQDGFAPKIKLSARAVGYRKSALDVWLTSRQGA